MNEEEDITGGGTDEQIYQAYKEAKINEQKDPRTDEKFLEQRAKEKEQKSLEPKESNIGATVRKSTFKAAESGLIGTALGMTGPAGKVAGGIITGGANILDIFFSPDKDGNLRLDPKIQDALPSISSMILDDKKFLPKDDTKGALPEADFEANFLNRVFSTGRGEEISKAISEYLQSMMTNYGIKGPRKNNPPPEKIRKILGMGGTEENPVQLTLIEDFVNSIVNDEQQAGASYQTLTYGNINSAIEQLSEEDLTPEEKIKYAQQNVPESSIDIEDYVKNFGSSLISRKPLHVNLVKPFQKKYGATDAAVERYVKLANRNVRQIKNTIAYLNYKYKETLPTAEINDIAADMSLLFGQDIKPETIDAIIKGQGGEILFQTQGMKNRKQDPFSIKTREDLLKVYKSRLNLLNKHGAFDAGHVYAADQLLKDHKVSNASMFRNLDAEIRASILTFVSKPELKKLIEGQLTKGEDYIVKIIGNRSKKAGGDPADKIFEQLYGNAYGLEEDFKNFLFPEMNIANMIDADLKSRFGRQYTKRVNEILDRFKGTEGGPSLKAGEGSLNAIRRMAMADILQDYVINPKLGLTDKDVRYQNQLKSMVNFFDMLLGREMVNPDTGELFRGDEESGGGYALTLDDVLNER